DLQPFSAETFAASLFDVEAPEDASNYEPIITVNEERLARDKAEAAAREVERQKKLAAEAERLAEENRVGEIEDSLDEDVEVRGDMAEDAGSLLEDLYEEILEKFDDEEEPAEEPAPEVAEEVTEETVEEIGETAAAEEAIKEEQLEEVQEIAAALEGMTEEKEEPKEEKPKKKGFLSGLFSGSGEYIG
ncbi:MAG: hypothetical protein IK046_03140, partial [Clostridia bacterium]|nr:hypothetical protein [Clostridia bacterium]